MTRGQNVARHRSDLRNIGDLLDQHDELVAAEPRHDVARAQALLQPRAHLAQQHVAGIVAQRVVDHFETIEVDEQHGELAVVAARRFDREIQQLAEHRTVRQPGEAVVRREILDPLLRALARRDVLDDRDVVDGLARAVALRSDGEAHPDGRTVLAQVTLLDLEGLDLARAQLQPKLVGDAHVAGMGNLPHRQREQLLLRVIEHLAELRVRVDEAPLVVHMCDPDGRERHRGGETFLAFAQALDRDRPLIEVTDLRARDAQHAQELRLRRRNSRRVEIQHSDRRRTRLQRDHEARVPAVAADTLDLRRTRVARDVADPHGAAVQPARQLVPFLEHGAVLIGRIARADEVPQRARALVDDPQIAGGPLLGLAHREQRRAYAGGEVVGLRERARDEALEVRQMLGAHPRAHVLRDAAIALEAAALIESGLPAEAQVADAALRAERMHDVAKRSVIGERRPMTFPAVAADGRTGAQLPARLAADVA